MEQHGHPDIQRPGGKPREGIMERLESLSGGFYWIALNGNRLLKGRSPFDSVELQPKFIDATERAGR